MLNLDRSSSSYILLLQQWLGAQTRAALLLCLALWLILPQPAAALTIDADAPSQTLVDSISYFIEQVPLNIEHIHGSRDIDWQATQAPINFGYSSDVHWFRFSLINADVHSLERLLHVSYPLLDHIAVYLYSNDRMKRSFATGDALPFAHRPYEHRQFIFPLVLAPSSTHTVYVRVQTQGSLQLPLTIWQERAFHVVDAKTNIVTAMYYGVLLIMAAFNLLLYFSLRDKAYLYYVYFVLSMFILMSGLYGYAFQYLYPQFPDFHGLVILIAVPLTQIAICLFTMTFLKLAESSALWYRIFVGFISINGLLVVAALVFPYNISTLLSVVLTLPIAICAMFMGLQFWCNGDGSARLFSIAWIAFLLGAAGSVLNRLGVIPTSFFIEHGMPISTTAQTVIFALALASRVNTERDGRLRVQQEYLEEIRKRREAEMQLVYAASHHEITGLPNRVLFEKSMRPFIETPQNGREVVAIFLIHVRRFDDVNKTLGHRNADVLLRRIGERINEVVRGSHNAVPLDLRNEGAVFAAHIEGVSFCFALAKSDREQILHDVDELMRLMSAPIEFMGLSLELGFLVGCSFAETCDSEPQTLLRQAFIAFDRVDTKLSSIAVYEPQMNPYSPKRLTLMTELRSAIEHDGLELYFQPQIDLSAGSVCGFEALLRWKHHEFGFVPPDEFIPMAEKTGLMKPLTRWVVQQAMVFCKRLKEQGCFATVSINISALNLREMGFCEQVVHELREADIEPARLVLEVTETAAMVDPISAAAVLNNLHAAEVRLSIDDFGTGHSSLAYIRQLPVHEIKIDRSFVSEMHINKDDATIVRTTINMCHDLGYEVVAEGVECEAVVALLKAMKCDVMQGYHISRPMNAKDSLEWLQQTEWNIVRV